MRLSDLKPGQSATITKVMGYGGFRRRILEMGFVRGKVVEAVQSAPLNDPVKYKIMDYEVSLRRSEARLIEVITDEEAEMVVMECNSRRGQHCTETIESVIKNSSNKIRVALVGNPNSGKTSLFNAISGGREHVGNYSGVTVDVKRGTVHHRGYEIEIYDLPGTYALSAYSPEEVYVRRHITETMPDVVLNVVAASNLERNLYLTTELIDMHLSVVAALNMYDELEASGATLDISLLGELLGIEFVPTNARLRQGINELLDAVIANFEGERGHHIHIGYGREIDEAIEELVPLIKKDETISTHYHSRYVALKMVENDSDIDKELRHSPIYNELTALRNRRTEHIKSILGEDIETAVANEKYGFIAGAMAECYRTSKKEQQTSTRTLDTILTHRIWGFPLFFLFMWIMFETTFVLGAYPMEWLESLMGWLGGVIETNMTEGMFRDLLVDGVIGGVGGVIVFLPNILILYFFIALMEDSGYMARAAFIMDRVMHRIGLHGKSFIPLLMGFGCNVPAIMATRTIESRSSRLITILITPFMSCGARLPVYLLIAGAFFGASAGFVMFCLYVLGIIIAAITARLMRKILFKKEDTPFVMELPPYRMPTGRATLHHMWERAAQYLKKMGGIVLICSLVIWFLSYFPQNDDPQVQAEQSYIGQAGKFIEPVVEPLGMNWKGGVALISGAAAKEVVVSTLAVLYSTDEEENLGEALKADNPQIGKPDWTSASALAFMVFVLLYFPCVAVLAAVRSETGRWRWALFTIVYTTAVAWGVAWITYKIALLFM